VLTTQKSTRSRQAEVVAEEAESQPPVAQLDAVTKAYGKTVALRGLDLAVAPGKITALLGPNGAGKSTAISLLVGLRRPDAGTVRLFGADPRRPATRRRLGVTPQDTGFPDTLTVGEIVDFVGRHYPEPEPAADLLARFGLAEVAGRRASRLSGGQRRRLAVALAFVGRPDLVVLDEPTTGLDVQSRQQVWAVVSAHVRRGGTVVLTTHYLEEAEALADRVVVINAGAVVAQGSVAEITGRVSGARVRIRVPADALTAVLPALPQVSLHEVTGDVHEFVTADADELVRVLVRRDVPFSGLEVSRVSLEEMFLLLTAPKEPAE
jgi:ABC-2 type transport system ATP-binding protein